MLSRGDHRERRKHEIDYRTDGNGAHRRNSRDEGHEKGVPWRTSCERSARQGEDGEQGYPEEESAQKRTKRRSRGQQNGHDPGTAEAAGRGDCQRTAQGHWLAATFLAGLSVGNRRQENGP